MEPSNSCDVNFEDLSGSRLLCRRTGWAIRELTLAVASVLQRQVSRRSPVVLAHLRQSGRRRHHLGMHKHQCCSRATRNR